MDLSVISNAAHPGGAKTDLQRHSGLFDVAAKTFAMEPAAGALPQLYAATDPAAGGGSYIGPGGLYEMWGAPKPAKIARQAKKENLRRDLWTYAQDATGVEYP